MIGKNHRSFWTAFLSIACVFGLLVPTASAQWANMPGKCDDIAADGGTVWCIGQDKAVYKWNESAFNWESKGGTAGSIGVDANGTPWVIEKEQVYRLRGENWQNMPGKCKDIAGGGGTIWCIGQDKKVYKWNEEAFGWQNFGGTAGTIGVDSDGTPWVIQKEQVYRLRGKNWQNMPGKCDDIAGGGGTVWCVGQDKSVYKWNEEAFGWQNKGGTAGSIGVDSDGTPWVIQKEQVYRFKG